METIEIPARVVIMGRVIDVDASVDFEVYDGEVDIDSVSISSGGEIIDLIPQDFLIELSNLILTGEIEDAI